MDKSFGQNDPSICDYVYDLFRPEDSILKEIRDRTAKAEMPDIHVAAMDARLLEVLTRASGAKKAVEIGTLAGYSGVCIVRGLQPGGMLYTFEYEPKHAEVSRESFKKAGVENQVRLFVGPALENLSKIESEGPFDLVFIDADKVSYPAYLDWAAKHLRIGGVFLADNTFAFGEIADQSKQEEGPVALRKLNHRAATDARFRSTIIPTGEGMTMGVKVS